MGGSAEAHCLAKDAQGPGLLATSFCVKAVFQLDCPSRCDNVVPRRREPDIIGWWRSLVAHLTGGQGVAGSNPVHPTRNCRWDGIYPVPPFFTEDSRRRFASEGPMRVSRGVYCHRRSSLCMGMCLRGSSSGYPFGIDDKAFHNPAEASLAQSFTQYPLCTSERRSARDHAGQASRGCA